MGACGAICHAASADASTIVSATSLGASASWNVQSGASMTTSNSTPFTYMGLYPDGTLGMTATNYGAIYTTNATSRLFDTKTGASIAAPGWDSVINAAGTPSFSPDGKQIAFMREDQDAHTIAKADFNASTKTFSNLVNLATGASGYAGQAPTCVPPPKGCANEFESCTWCTECTRASRQGNGQLRMHQPFDRDRRRRTRIVRPTKRPSTPARAPKATPGPVLPRAAVAQPPPVELDCEPGVPVSPSVPPPLTEASVDAPPSTLACACVGVPVPTTLQPL